LEQEIRKDQDFVREQLAIDAGHDPYEAEIERVIPLGDGSELWFPKRPNPAKHYEPDESLAFLVFGDVEQKKEPI